MLAKFRSLFWGYFRNTKSDWKCQILADNPTESLCKHLQDSLMTIGIPSVLKESKGDELRTSPSVCLVFETNGRVFEKVSVIDIGVGAEQKIPLDYSGENPIEGGAHDIVFRDEQSKKDDVVGSNSDLISSLVRLLFFYQLVDHDFVEKHYRPPVTNDAPILIYVPEVGIRSKSLTVNNSFNLFPGLIGQPSWKSIAFTYKLLAKQLTNKGLETALILEDDAILQCSSSELYDQTFDFLKSEKVSFICFSGTSERTKVWGNMNAEILGQKVLQVDRISSLVCVGVAKSGLKRLAHWDYSNSNPFRNTIEPFLCSSQKSQITFAQVVDGSKLVQHDSKGESLVWGVDSEIYDSKIHGFWQSISKKVKKYEIDKARDK